MTTADFDSFYTNLSSERNEFQSKIIDLRIKALSKINDDEWQKIIALSNESVKKAESKTSKKEEKDQFKKLEQCILTNIQEKKMQEKAIASFKTLKENLKTLQIELSKINTKKNATISNRNSSKQELIKDSKELNELRTNAYKALQQFHFEIKSVTDKEVFTKIMKEINKLLG